VARRFELDTDPMFKAQWEGSGHTAADVTAVLARVKDVQWCVRGYDWWNEQYGMDGILGHVGMTCADVAYRVAVCSVCDHTHGSFLCACMDVAVCVCT
jgi:hypothetical protein